MVNIVGEFMMWLRLNFAASKAGVAQDYAKPAHHRSQPGDGYPVFAWKKPHQPFGLTSPRTTRHATGGW